MNRDPNAVRPRAALAPVAVLAGCLFAGQPARSAPKTQTHPRHLGLWPPPRQVEAQPEWLLRLPIQVAAPGELQLPASMLKKELARLFGDHAVQETGATVLSLRLDPDSLSATEAYSIETLTAGIELCAHDLRGMFWAAHTLLQLLSSPAVRRVPEGHVVPGVRVRDWPETEFRALMIQGA